ncbi:MAG: radical SAM protein [Muribaculaceae bacterium]|nr:radical SAM protein [Muribaculaceae bacterium]
MLTIIKTEPRILAILGDDRTTVLTQCCISPYVHVIVVKDGYVVTNILTNFIAYIQDWPKNDDQATVNHWWQTLTPIEQNILLQNRVVIANKAEEYNVYLQLWNFISALVPNDGFIRYNILTTNACNARCPYCFENEFLEQRNSMTVDKANKVADYIINTHSPSQPIYIRWFGGEPLVNTRVIDIISKRLNEKNVNFFSTMSTNGLACTPEIILRATQLWRMSKIRISLDGWGEDHNKRKLFVGTKDGFSTILSNMDAIISSGLMLSVRLNLDRYNYESLLKLSDYLIERFSKCPNFNMYCRCLFDDISIDAFENNRSQMQELLAQCYSLEKKLIDNNVYDCERLAPNGFRTFFCAAHDPRKIVITPSGGVCKCECLASDKVSWGKIGEKIENQEIYDTWHKDINLVRDKCRHCSLLPLCSPYNVCPSQIHCVTRFEHTLQLYLEESYDRWLQGLDPIEMKDEIHLDIDYVPYY